MEFASMTFIWLFLPTTLALYYVSFVIKRPSLRTVFQNTLLIFASLFFYFWVGKKAVLLLLALSLVNYLGAIFYDKITPDTKGKKAARRLGFIVVLLLDLFILCFYKYYNVSFTLYDIITTPTGSARELIVNLFKFNRLHELDVKNIAMPLALSFIIFQSVSYISDVYQRKIKAEKNILNFLLYSTFFAKTVQGPIMRYGDLGSQIVNREHTVERFSSGIKRFAYGLGKKVIIANTVAVAADKIWALEVSDLSTSEAWLGVILYTIQIYYDFSGYTDMAIGVGKMFGFTIVENFDYPYTSMSVQEFWRRWHISLSTWFKNYIYIPLGGNRKGLPRTLFNLFVVFLVTGIWHGATLNFVFWGLWFAVLSVLERLFLGNLLKKNPVKPLNIVYTLLAVMLGWVLFRAPNMYVALKYLKIMFTGVPISAERSIIEYFSADLFFAVIFGILFSGLLQRPLKKVYEKISDTAVVTVIDVVLQFAILIWSVLLMAGGSFTPSIYGAF